MAQKSKEKPTILVVDDEKDVLVLLQYKLSAEGFNVKISQNGDNIIDIIHQAHPNIILLDIHMNGVDGGTICHLIKSNESTATIPVIMFSANENVKNITEECGADGFIKKPLNSINLKETFLRILGNEMQASLSN